MLLALALAHAAPIAATDVAEPTAVVLAHEAPATPGSVAIINGEEAAADLFPESGGILQRITATMYGAPITVTILSCTGTLIAPDTVLAAAHCVDPDILALSLGIPASQISSIEYGFDPSPDLTAYASMFSLERNFPSTAAVGTVAVYPDEWNFAALNIGLATGNNLGDYHDISLIFLDEPVDAPFAYLPTEAEGDQLEEGHVVDIVGWGQRDASTYSTAVGTKYHGESFINEMARFEFQVGAEADDVRKCHGDSGGPTFMEVDTDSAVTHRVVGVTSHAYDMTDCNEKGGVDTRVDYHLEWIDAEMTAACDDGLRSWCEWPGIIPPPDADGYHAWEDKPEPEPEPETTTTPTDGEGGSTTDATDDVDDDSEEEGDEASSEKAGGCSTVPGTAGGLMVLVGLLGARRRDHRR